VSTKSASSDSECGGELILPRTHQFRGGAHDLGALRDRPIAPVPLIAGLREINHLGKLHIRDLLERGHCRSGPFQADVAISRGVTRCDDQALVPASRLATEPSMQNITTAPHEGHGEVTECDHFFASAPALNRQ
jgi:hypothetical protein